jgi:hypothetical protein
LTDLNFEKIYEPLLTLVTFLIKDSEPNMGWLADSFVYIKSSEAAKHNKLL